MWRPLPLILLLTLLGPGELRPQSPSPDSRYVLRADAEYVTGYPYVPRGRHDQPLPVRGDVYLGLDALRFRYCSEKPEGPPDPLAEGLAAWVDKNRCGGRCAAKSCLEVRIPYERMKLLARGRVVGMGGTSEDVQVASAGIGIAGLIASVTTGGTTEKWLIGGTIAAAAAGFGFHEYTLKRANYLSIYFVPPRQSDPTLPCLSNSLPPGPRPPNSAQRKPPKQPATCSARQTAATWQCFKYSAPITIGISRRFYTREPERSSSRRAPNRSENAAPKGGCSLRRSIAWQLTLQPRLLH